MSHPPNDKPNPPEILDWRIQAMERAHADTLGQIKTMANKFDTRLEAMALKLDAAMTHMRAHACPTPGACTSLMRDTAELGKALDRFEKIIEKHETDIANLRMTAAEGRVGLKVTIFWVSLMSSSVGGLVALVLPIFINLLRAR